MLGSAHEVQRFHRYEGVRVPERLPRPLASSDTS